MPVATFLVPFFRRCLPGALAVAIPLSVALMLQPSSADVASTARLSPIADGFATQWSTFPLLTAHWDRLNDDNTSTCENFETGDYVFHQGGGGQDYLALDSTTVPDGATVTSVDVIVCHRRHTNGGGHFYPFYRVDGVRADGAVIIADGDEPVDRFVGTIDGADLTKTSSIEIGLQKTGTGTSARAAVRVYSISAVFHYEYEPPERTIRVTKVTSGTGAPDIEFAGTITAGDGSWELGNGDSEDFTTPTTAQTVTEGALSPDNWEFGGYAEREGLVGCDGAVYGGAREDGLVTIGAGDLTVCVLNIYNQPIRTVEVCKAFAANSDGVTEPATIFDFELAWDGGDVTTSIARAEGAPELCAGVDVPEAASVTVTETGPAGYTTTNSVDGGGATAALGDGSRVVFTNTRAARPLPVVTKVAGDPSFVAGEARWDITVDNTAPGGVARMVAVTEQPGAVFNDFTACAETSGETCTVTVAAGGSMSLSVSAPATQQCEASTASNAAAAAIVDASGNLLVDLGGTGDIVATVPADPAACGGTLTVYLDNTSGDAADTFVSAPASDVTWSLQHGQSSTVALSAGNYAVTQSSPAETGAGYLAPAYRTGSRDGDVIICDGSAVAADSVLVSAGAETTVCVVNTLAALPAVTKTGMQPVGGDFAWRIVIDNTAPNALPRTIVLVDEDVSLAPDALCGQVGDTITCGPVAAGTSLEVTVTRDAGGPACANRTALNAIAASLTVGANSIPLPGVTGVEAHVPGDPAVCTMPVLEKMAAGYEGGSGHWQITVTNAGDASMPRTVSIDDPGVVLVEDACGALAGDPVDGVECALAAGGSVTLLVQQPVARACEPAAAANVASAFVGGEHIQASPTAPVAVVVPGDPSLCPATLTVETYVDADAEPAALSASPSPGGTLVNGWDVVLACENAGVLGATTGDHGPGVAIFTLTGDAGPCVVSVDGQPFMQPMGYWLEDDGVTTTGSATSAIAVELSGADSDRIAFVYQSVVPGDGDPAPTRPPGPSPEEPDPQETAEPTSTATPTPTGIASPTATGTETPSSTANATATPSETAPATSTVTASPTPGAPNTGSGGGAAAATGLVPALATVLVVTLAGALHGIRKRG